MKILHVSYIFPPKPNVADGITQVVHRLTKTLAKKGNDVPVYASNALDLHGEGILGKIQAWIFGTLQVITNTCVIRVVRHG